VIRLDFSRAACVAASLALLLVACDGTPERPSSARGPRDAPPSSEPPPLAVYQTSLTYVGFGPDPALLHLRLENRTEPGELLLDYRGWAAAAEGWTPVLDVTDSVPVPRAAWRPLPVGPLRLRVGEGARLATVVLDLPGSPVRIEAGPELSTWSGTTGRRESLRTALLERGDRQEAGLLLQRQRARPADQPPGDRSLQVFLVTDSLGDALVLLRDRAFPDAPATAWALVDEVTLDWSETIVLSLSAPTGSPGRWSYEVRDSGVFGELEGVGPVLDRLPATGSGFRLFRVRGTISFGEERRPVVGIGFEERGP
jgi:hypothetical protein